MKLSSRSVAHSGGILYAVALLVKATRASHSSGRKIAAEKAISTRCGTVRRATLPTVVDPSRMPPPSRAAPIIDRAARLAQASEPLLSAHSSLSSLLILSLSKEEEGTPLSGQEALRRLSFERA